MQPRSYFRMRLLEVVILCLCTCGTLTLLFEAPLASAAERGKPVDLTTAITRVAQENIPAVVSIEVTEQHEVANPLLPFEGDPFFRRFFNIPKKMPKKFKQEMKGLGSGMIMDIHGHILTNYHVAGGATKIEVILSNGVRYSAKLVGGDPKTDLAVIRITAKEPLPHVVFGDSDKTEVGEWVVVIGAPRALEKSVTHGIISAKHRTGVSDPNSFQDFLQTDAAINPGNSGGPLLNLYGEVIGVNAAIATESGGFEGIGFTIPSNMALYVAKALIAHGKVERGWIGVSIHDLTPEQERTHHVAGSKGALVAEVTKGGPAEKAGIHKEDVIVSFQGKEVSGAGAFRNEVAQTPAGQEVKVVVLRGGKQETLTVKVGRIEEAAKILEEAIKERLGAEVRTPTASEVDKYGLSPGNGVVITLLDMKGPLHKAGFEVGDMILAISDQPVSGVESLAAMIETVKPAQRIQVLCLDHRSGNSGTILTVVR